MVKDLHGHPVFEKGWWACCNRPFPTHGRFQKDCYVAEVEEGQSLVTVHHRPVNDDQHELSYQGETGGVPCPCNRSWLEGHCGCHGEELTGVMTRKQARVRTFRMVRRTSGHY